METAGTSVNVSGYVKVLLNGGLNDHIDMALCAILLVLLKQLQMWKRWECKCVFGCVYDCCGGNMVKVLYIETKNRIEVAYYGVGDCGGCGGIGGDKGKQKHEKQ